MPRTPTAARVLGALLLVQLAGLIAPFAMIHPLVPAEFLPTAALYATQVKVAVILLGLNALLSIGIALLVRSLLGPAHEGSTLFLVMAAAAWFTLQSVDNAHLFSLLTLSQRAQGAAAPLDQLGPVADALHETRRWIHHATLMAIELWMVALYTALHRSAAVPRILSWFGLLTVAAHFGGVIVPMFLRIPMVTPLAMLMGVSEIALAVWLLVKGTTPHLEGA